MLLLVVAASAVNGSRWSVCHGGCGSFAVAAFGHAPAVVSSTGIPKFKPTGATVAAGSLAATARPDPSWIKKMSSETSLRPVSRWKAGVGYTIGCSVPGTGTRG